MKRNRQPQNMTAVERWEICQLYGQSRTKLKAIAAQYGRAVSTVHAIIKTSGVPLRNNRREKRHV